MSKMSETRKLKKGVIPRTPFTPAECIEIQEMQRIINARRFEAQQIKANTALVPRGQDVAAEIEAIGRLLDNTKNQWVAQRLQDHGYPQNTKCDINLTTGEVVVQGELEAEAPAEEPKQDDKPKNRSKAAK